MMFSTEYTDIPWYDGMLKHPEYYRRAKGLTYEIRYMTPREYMKLAAELQNTPLSIQYMMVDESLLRQYMKEAENGAVFPMPVIDYATGTQEGRHRAVLAERLGVKSIPVMIVKRVEDISVSPGSKEVSGFYTDDRGRRRPITYKKSSSKRGVRCDGV